MLMSRFNDDPVRTLHVHSFVLVTRSPVFERWLSHECIENERMEVEIPDFSLQVVEGMIHWMYTEEVKSMQVRFVLS